MAQSQRTADNATPMLFRPMQVGTLELFNRILVAPMTRVSATPAGVATEQMRHYYARFADHGFALVETEGTYTDEAYSQGYEKQPGIANDEQQAAWRRVVEAVHARKVPIMMQLMHAGALSQYNHHSDSSVAPSALQPKGEQMSIYRGSGPYATPQALSRFGMETITQGFVRAAERSREAGFDAIEVHGANGYLLDEFLSETTNYRSDDYGGSAAARVRFPAQVVARIRKALGPDYTLGIRISLHKVNDAEYRWSGGEDDARIIFRALGEAGADFIVIAREDSNQPEGGWL